MGYNNIYYKLILLRSLAENIHSILVSFVLCMTWHLYFFKPCTIIGLVVFSVTTILKINVKCITINSCSFKWLCSKLSLNTSLITKVIIKYLKFANVSINNFIESYHNQLFIYLNAIRWRGNKKLSTRKWDY